MGKETEISWTDSTFNPWWGCRKIAPGCDNCYAATFDHRLGGSHWKSEYKTMGPDYWKRPIKWNTKALKNNKRHRVFCGSMCDWADSMGPESEREKLWELIRKTPMIDWLLLTKRANRIEKCLPEDWGNGYDNVWLGVTVEDRKFGLPRIDILRKIPAKIRFLSVEPLLEDLGLPNFDGINWIVSGGESGTGAREMKEDWLLGVQWHCKMQNVAFHFKQWGCKTNDGANPNEKKGGCLLNGSEFKEWPNINRKNKNGI